MWNFILLHYCLSCATFFLLGFCAERKKKKDFFCTTLQWLSLFHLWFLGFNLIILLGIVLVKCQVKTTLRYTIFVWFSVWRKPRLDTNEIFWPEIKHRLFSGLTIRMLLKFYRLIGHHLCTKKQMVNFLENSYW